MSVAGFSAFFGESPIAKNSQKEPPPPPLVPGGGQGKGLFNEIRKNSQYVSAEILIFDHVGQLIVDIGGVDLEFEAAAVGGLEGDLVQDLFHDGMEASGADILGALVHQGGEVGDFRESFGTELCAKLL